MNALTHAQNLPPAPGAQDIITFTQEQVELIKKTICKGASDDEFKLFMYVAKRSGLDPFMKQVHAVFRKDWKTGQMVMSIQTGIDGYRLIADRTGDYAGQDEPVFEFPAGFASNGKLPPSKASVTVYKIVRGVRCAFTGTAHWDEYYPGNKMWDQRPKGQLAKCAEALALRKAFPAEIGSLRTDEEMDQAEIEARRAQQAEDLVNRSKDMDYQEQPKQLEDIKVLLGQATEGKTLQQKGEFMVKNLGVGKFDELTKKTSTELSGAIEKLRQEILKDKKDKPIDTTTA